MDANRWIVVGIDFSEGSTHALERALKLADKTGASIACVHAYEDAADTPACHDPAPALRKEIEQVIAACRTCNPAVRVEVIVRRGAPWDKLLNVAFELGAELIVLGADGQRGASHERLLGTVTSRVAASSRSVLVVPSHSDAGVR